MPIEKRAGASSGTAKPVVQPASLALMCNCQPRLNVTLTAASAEALRAALCDPAKLVVLQTRLHVSPMYGC